MSKRNLLLLLFLMVAWPAAAQNWITGYYVDTSLYMPDIPWSKLTHAVHFRAYPADGNGSLTGIPPGNADQFTSAAHAAGVKALVCINENYNDPKAFGTASGPNLDAFVSSIVTFVNVHNYDGVDLDWEGSNYTSGSADRTNYINLINALRSALGPKKLITISVYWNNGLEGVVQAAIAALNQVNVMCYDMDQWITWTYHNDATYRPAGDTDNCSCAAEAAQFASYIPASKIGLGIPFYGRVWSGCADAACSDGLHDPGQAWSGKPSQRTIYYKDLIASPYWSSPKVWDSARGASYISIDQPGAADDRFVTFTGVEQINDIVKLGRKQGYGGFMLFEVEYDFVSSATGDARHPLATAAYAAIKGNSHRGPVISDGSPSGKVDSDTRDLNLAVTTDMNATCKYATTAGRAYSDMVHTFRSTGGVNHSTPIGELESNRRYHYYVRCADADGNANTSDYPVSFTVGDN